jgi:hypothetical protein
VGNRYFLPHSDVLVKKIAALLPVKILHIIYVIGDLV